MPLVFPWIHVHHFVLDEEIVLAEGIAQGNETAAVLIKFKGILQPKR